MLRVLEIRIFEKKQKLFNEMLAAYRDAAAYPVAQSTIAAKHKIGNTFEEFSRALINTPRASGPSEHDLARYEGTLKQKVRPFQERALEAYRDNMRLAEDRNVQNLWAEKSYPRAQILTIKLGVATHGDATNEAVEQSASW